MNIEKKDDMIFKDEKIVPCPENIIENFFKVKEVQIIS
jgi:hypothetical protein